MSLIQDFQQPPKTSFPSLGFSLPPRLTRNFRRVIKADLPVERTPVPSHWRRLPFEYKGVNMRLYYVEANNPVACEWSALGLNSSIEENVADAELTRRQGISSFLLQIPTLQDAQNIEFYNELMVHFFIRNTPYYNSYSDLVRIFRGHSTSGHGITRASMHEETASEIVDRSDLVVQVSPFAAPEFIKSEWQRRLQALNTRLYGERFYGDAPFDKIVHYAMYRFRGYPYFSEDPEERMRHNEIDYMTYACAEILDDLTPDAFPQCVKNHNFQVLLGESDIVADPEFGALIAAFQNTEPVIVPNGRHNAPLEMPEGRQAIEDIRGTVIKPRALPVLYGHALRSEGLEKPSLNHAPQISPTMA